MFAKIFVTECLNKIIFGRNSSTSEAKKNVCHSFTGCLKFLDLQDNSGGEEAINVLGLNYVAKLDKERSGFLYKFPPHTSIGKFLVTDIWIGN